MDRFRGWMDRHAYLFIGNTTVVALSRLDRCCHIANSNQSFISIIGAPLKPESGEQDLEFYELFQDYLKMYEEELSTYINSMDKSVGDFYHQLEDVLNDKELKDKRLLAFANYLIASTDYPSFYKIMIRAGKRAQKAEAKGSGGADAKGTPGGGRAEGKGEGKLGADGDDNAGAKADFK